MLLHPVWWNQKPEVKKRIDWLLERVEFASIDNLL